MTFKQFKESRARELAAEAAANGEMTNGVNGTSHEPAARQPSSRPSTSNGYHDATGIPERTTNSPIVDRTLINPSTRDEDAEMIDP